MCKLVLYSGRWETENTCAEETPLPVHADSALQSPSYFHTGPLLRGNCQMSACFKFSFFLFFFLSCFFFLFFLFNLTWGTPMKIWICLSNSLTPLSLWNLCMRLTDVFWVSSIHNTHPFVGGMWVSEIEWREQGKQFEFRSSVSNIDSKECYLASPRRKRYLIEVH